MSYWEKKTCKHAALGTLISDAHSLPLSADGPGRAPVPQQVPVSSPNSLGVTLNSPSSLFFFCGLRLFPMCWKLRFLEHLEGRWNHQVIKNGILALSPESSEVFAGRCLCWITFFLSCFPDSSLLSYQYLFIRSHAISIKIFRPKYSVIFYFVFLK